MHAWKKSLIFSTITVLVISSTISISSIDVGGRPLRLVAYTPMESMQNPTFAGISRDLRLVKQLGFDGIKLWDTKELYDKGLLEVLLTEAEGLSLKVNVVYQFPDSHDNFPPSQFGMGMMQQTIITIGSVTRSHPSIIWNSFFAPFDWTMDESARQKIVQSQNYRDSLEESVRTMKAADPSHKVRIALDFDPTIGFPSLKSVDGYGIMPYNLQENNFDPQRVWIFLAYFARENKPVYIDEWGLHTTHVVSHGVASSEHEKARLLLDFAAFADKYHVDWTYFMLTDRLPSISFENGADWGVLNPDRSFRESGVSIQSYLLVH